MGVRVVAHTPEPLVAFGLTQFLADIQDIELCAVATTVEELRTDVARQQPDVALVSLTKGIDAGVLQGIRTTHPTVPLVLWVEEDLPAEIAHNAVVDCGVRGLLRRTLPPDLLLKCLRKVGSGELWLEESLMAAFLKGRAVKVSRRESDLITLLAQGLKNKEIATALGLSEGTVKVYLSKLFLKLGVKDRFELALFSLRNLQYGAAPATPSQLRSLFLPRDYRSGNHVEADRKLASRRVS